MVLPVETSKNTQPVIGTIDQVPPISPEVKFIQESNLNNQPQIIILIAAPLLQKDKRTPIEGIAILKEIDGILDALREVQEPRQIKIVVEVATEQTLNNIFKSECKPLILHYIAHGMVSDQGIPMMLEDKEGIADPLNQEKLINILKTEPPCELAILNAFHTQELESVFERAGVPNILVINDRDNILDTEARLFAREFYKPVFAGKNIVDAVLDCKRSKDFTFKILPVGHPAHNNPLGINELPRGNFLEPEWPNNNLPTDELNFIGRRGELHQLAVELSKKNNNKCIALHGFGGIGKTALAIASGRWQQERKLWSNGVWLIKLQEVKDATTAKTRIIEVLEIEKFKDLEKWNALLILDDLDQIIRTDQDGIVSLFNELKNFRNIKLLVTSRDKLFPVITHEPIDVGGLSQMDAIAAFKEYAQETFTNPNDPDFVYIINFLEGYPLALKLAASFLKIRRCGLTRLKQELSQALEALDKRYKTKETSLQISLDITYNVLSTEYKEMFINLAIFPGGLGEELANLLWGREGMESLEYLLLYSMAELDNTATERRFRLPQPVREYAKGKRENTENAETFTKILEYFYFTISQLMEDEKRFSQEASNLSYFIEWGLVNENNAKNICFTARIIDVLGLKIQQIFPQRDLLEILNHALASAKRNTDIYAEAGIYKILGEVKLKRLGLEEAKPDFDNAIAKYEICYLSLREITENAIVQAFRTYIKIKIGDCQEMMKGYEQALRSYEEAQILYEEIEDAVGGWFPNPPRVMIARVKNKIAYRNLNLELFSFETVMVNEQGKVIKREAKEVGYFIHTLPENINLEMVSIPEGQFWMGSPEGEGYDWEKPQHLVKIAPFFIGKTPITQQQWRAVASLPKEQRELNLKPSRFEGDNLPVERVSWQDAIEFCARLSRYTGMNYRLPSEAEWEYACRAIQNPEELVKGVKKIPVYPPFHFGETITSELANYYGSLTYKEEPGGQYRGETTPVRSFLPNAFGLYDMHGNVWEWCLDPWHNNYEGAPGDGGVWDGNNNDNHYYKVLDNINVLIEDSRTHVLRGGSWVDAPLICRSACRLSTGFAYNFVGFRPVFSVQDSSPLHS
jgi:formylglycine-generating enzyme required for sulfatase activity/predicted ATPase/predicted DNA-binding protein YlxM (UPF0122 family)